MTYPTTLAESLALIGQTSPQTSATMLTTPIYGDALMFGADGTIDCPVSQVFILAQAGGMAGSDNFTISLEQDTVSSFDSGNAKAVTNSAGTAKSAAPSSDNKQVIINLKAEELDNANGFKYWRYKCLASADESITFNVAVFGADSRFGPASDFDLSTVVAIVK